MDSELDNLLTAAKKNLAETTKETASIESIVKSIPKLQSNIKSEHESVTTKSKSYSKPIKSIPLRNVKQVKPDTAGANWFDLGKPEVTPELKRDLQLLKMRHVLDPKRFYKKQDEQSKYFAIGTIQEDPTEFFSNRLTRRERKQTLAEEVLSTRRDYLKSKYKDIQKVKTSGRRKYQKKVRDMRA